MSKDTYFIKHDSNSRRDIKIMALIAEYGVAGYGMYWMLIEILREQPTYKLEMTKHLYLVIAKELYCSPKDCKKFIDDCINEFELLVEDEEGIYSPSLLRRMEKYDSIREARSAAGKQRWKNHGKKDDTEEVPFPDSKEDESTSSKSEKKKPTKTEEQVEKFLELFNKIKKMHAGNNFKPTKVLTDAAKKNLKKALKRYSQVEMSGAINEMFKAEWPKQNNAQTPTHLLAEKNMERYVEKFNNSTKNINTSGQRRGTIKYGANG